MISPALTARATRLRDMADLADFVPVMEARSYGQSLPGLAPWPLFLNPSLVNDRWHLGIGFVEGTMIEGSNDFLPLDLQPGSPLFVVVTLLRSSAEKAVEGGPGIPYLTGEYAILSARLSSTAENEPGWNIHTTSRQLFVLDAEGNIPSTFRGTGEFRITPDLTF